MLFIKLDNFCDFRRKIAKEVAFSWTMWYSTVKLLEIGTFAMQWITAGELRFSQVDCGFLFVNLHKYIVKSGRDTLPYGEIDEMNTNAGKMQDCACIFPGWAVYLSHVNILLPRLRHEYYKNAAGFSSPNHVKEEKK